MYLNWNIKLRSLENTCVPPFVVFWGLEDEEIFRIVSIVFIGVHEWWWSLVSVIVFIDPTLEEEFAAEEGYGEEADPNPHIDGAFLSEMLSFKGFGLEVEIF
jgi:hypothetical protein